MDLPSSLFEKLFEIVEEVKPLKIAIEDQWQKSLSEIRKEPFITRLQIIQIFQLFHQANVPQAGFLIGLNPPMGLFGSLDYYLASCKTLGYAILAMVKYHSLFKFKLPPPSVNKTKNAMVKLGFVSNQPREIELQYASEITITAYIGMIQRLAQVWPTQIELPKQAYNQSNRNLFLSLAQMNITQGENYQLFYPESAFNIKLPFANENLVNLLETEIEQQLRSIVSSDSTIDKVINVIKSANHLGEISLMGVAESLFMSESSLKRALAAEHTRFSNIINSYKKNMAMTLVLDQQVKIESIAHQLGYSDRGSFERAFKVWFKSTPLQLKTMTDLMGIDAKQITTSDIFALPASPQGCQQILQTMQKDHYEIKELAQVINNDPIIAGKLIGMASSAYYGGRTITNVEDAIVKVLGVEMVQNMTLSIMANRELHLDECPHFDVVNNWLLGLATAEACKEFIHCDRIKKSKNVNFLMLAALLHNIGTFAIVHLRVEEAGLFLKLMIDSEADTRLDLQLELQQKVFSITNFEVAGLLLTHWGLPLSICEVVKNLKSAYVGNSKVETGTLLLANLSGFIRHFLRFGEDSDLTQQWVKKLSVQLDLSIEEVKKKLAKVCEKIEQLTQVAKMLTSR